MLIGWKVKWVIIRNTIELAIIRRIVKWIVISRMVTWAPKDSCQPDGPKQALKELSRPSARICF